MSGSDARQRGRASARNAATKQEILDAAWSLAREQGLAGITMRDLGERVGMRAQSLYAYYPAKHAIYDAMFAAAHRVLLERLEALAPHNDPRRRLRRNATLWLEFCAEDPVRYQLLYQRTLPGFEPSTESYELARQTLEHTRACLNACGITAARAVDAWTVLTTGIVAQQTANEPGGRRWLRLSGELTNMYLDHFAPEKRGTS